MDDKWHFAVDLYQGTAEYYDRYRLPYPEAMTEDLIARAGVCGQGRPLTWPAVPASSPSRYAGPSRKSGPWTGNPSSRRWSRPRLTGWAQEISARSRPTPRPWTRNPGTSSWPSSAAPSTGSTATWSPPGCCTGSGPAGTWRCAGRTSRNWVTGSGNGRSRRCLTGGRPRSARPTGSPRTGPGRSGGGPMPRCCQKPGSRRPDATSSPSSTGGVWRNWPGTSGPPRSCRPRSSATTAPPSTTTSRPPSARSPPPTAPSRTTSASSTTWPASRRTGAGTGGYLCVLVAYPM